MKLKTKNYEVQSGDTLGAIASDNNTFVKELMQLTLKLKIKILLWLVKIL